MKADVPVRSAWTATEVFLGSIPFMGFFVDVVDSVYFQKFLAAFLLELLQTAGQVATSSLVEWLFSAAT